MKRVLTLQSLENLFKEAQRMKAKYIGVKIEMDGFKKPEVIINPSDNFDKKLEYYKKAYNDDLTLKATSSIRIVDFVYGNTFDCLEYDLLHT